MARGWTAALVTLTMLGLTSARAQDATFARTIDTVTITAERSPAPIARSTASVARIDASELKGLPHATVADALRLVPGFATVDADGSGFEPRVMVRGFYGGGETDYAIVMVDGRPVNQLQSSAIAWETLPPLEAIEAIEIVRGSSSPLHGDAAVAAVINIITNRSVNRASGWSLSRGSFDAWRLTGGAAGDFLWRNGTISAVAHGTNGFRDHSDRTSARMDGGLLLRATPGDSVMLETSAFWRDTEDPGPLLDSLFASDRSASDPFFRYDGSRDRGLAVRVRGLDVDDRTRATASLGVEHRLTDVIRTIALAPDLGVTSARDIVATTVETGAQIHGSDTRLPGTDEILVGVDASHGWLGSKYYATREGDRAEYASAGGTPGEGAFGRRGRLSTEADGTRTAAALFAQYSVALRPSIRLSLGARYDRLWDHNTATKPSPYEQRIARSSHSAFSPKAGINVRYMNRSASSGHAYLTASRSFRTPTLDQLFDQSTFAPDGEPTSNPALTPQRGVNIEAGVYQSMLLGDVASVSFTLSAYQMDMEDEIDFDPRRSDT